MRIHRTATALVLAAAVGMTACETPPKDTPATAPAVDSVAFVRQQLVDEITASTAFVDEIMDKLEKARVFTMTPAEPGDLTRAGGERQEVLEGVTRLVARLDSMQTRLTAYRTQVSAMGRKETALLAQIASFQKQVGELQVAAEGQRVELQGIVDLQRGQIVALASQVDTLEKTRVALTDTVGRLTAQKNAAYVVIGTRDELIKKGILVAEGQKRFFLAGSRPVAPARNLDPSSFTKIDRVSERTIILPDGEYQILTRQNPEFATATSARRGKIGGVLTIDQPEHFWESSPFLIIVKS